MDEEADPAQAHDARVRLPADTARLRRRRSARRRSPGRRSIAEVGDTIVVHFRNADRKLNQAVTVHPHGVRYNPEYDGAYLGDYTRAGGFVEPGEEFTYTWEATPDSVGVWPYHDHGPNHTLNTIRGLFGGIIVRERGAAWPDVEELLFLHNFPPQVTGIPRLFHCINGRAFAGNTPTVRAKVGQRVAMHAIGMDGNFHTFHIHGHRWRDAVGRVRRLPDAGPERDRDARTSWRTTQGGGSTTATSSATRTPAWPAGTWWSSEQLEEEGEACACSLLAAVLAAAVPGPRHDGDGRRLPGAEGPRQGAEEPRARARP